jgi:hypothetical protein
MMACEMEVMLMHIYSLRVKGVPMQKCLQSKVANLAPGVEMMLLRKILVVEMPAVGVLPFPG